MSTPPSFAPQPCCDGAASAACSQPMQFCQTGTSTAPVDHPGRQYDITLPINPGFAVQSMTVVTGGNSVDHAAGITWDVADPDGEQFRQDLTQFMDGRLPSAAVVTITNPNAGQTICGTAAAMQIHIECLRLDQNPPDLIELVYNAGQDLIINPAYNETPPLNPPVAQGNYGFHLLGRQDNNTYPQNQPSNRVNCTNVANRGWETNDVGNTFEIWGQDQSQTQNVTPTPRGTPVQEMTSDGAPSGKRSTVWQTFVAPASAPFVIQLVHGARDPGETHRITLDNGDTDDQQNGHLINDNTTPAVVTSSGGPNPWTQFNQTIPLTSGQTYTLALSSNNPVAFNRGGLFTDMRAYIDRPNTRATAVNNDDTCVVTVTETSTTNTCSFWQPQCVDGTIAGWENVATNLRLTNAEFWAQVPTPKCCTSEQAPAEGGGSVQSNMAVSDVVCAVVGGIPQNAIRQVVLDPSGGQLVQTFLSTSGAPISPTSWTPGSCAGTITVVEDILCDLSFGNGFQSTPFRRATTYQVDTNNNPQVIGHRDFQLSTDAPYIITGTVGDCGMDVEVEILCDTGFLDTVGPTAGQYHRFQRKYYFSSAGNLIFVQDSNLDGTGYTPVNGGVACDALPTEGMTLGLCLADGTPIGVVMRRIGTTPPVQDGWINLRTGVFSAGNPPAGAVSCGSSQSIQTSGVFCVTDDTSHAVLELVLVEYHYDASGAIDSVRIVKAEDGTTYTIPAGASLNVCPEGQAQPTPQAVVLCDANGQFLRDYRRDLNGAVTGFTDYTMAGAAYTPSGAVRVCGTSVDVETMVLCDVPLSTGLVNTFWRTWVYNADGTVASVIDRDQAGNPYTVSSGGLVTDCGGIDSEQTVLCDVSGAGVSTPFLRTEVRQANAILRRVDTDLGGINPYTPTGTVGLCTGRDSESVILCDSAAVPNRFVRTYTYDAAGAIAGFTDRTLAGAAFVPTGAVVLCTQPTATDLDFVVVQLCDVNAGVSTPFLRRFTFNSTTGAVTATTNTTLAGAAYTPTGTVGDCADPCCPVTVAEVCLANGNPGVILRLADGTLQRLDTVTGATFAPGDIVSCAPTVTAQMRTLAAGQSWTPGAEVTGTLTSVTSTTVSGTTDFVDSNGTAVTGAPTGYAVTWQNSEEGQLIGPQSITAVGGVTLINWTQH